MKQIIKITLSFGLLISLVSCQSSNTGCYDFGEVGNKITNSDTPESKSDIVFTSVNCKP